MSLNSKTLSLILCLAVATTTSSNVFAQDQGAIPGIKPAVIATEMSDEEMSKTFSMLLVYNQLAQMKMQLKGDGIELDQEAALEGARRVLAGEEVGIPLAKIQSVMSEMQKRVMASRQKKRQEMENQLREQAAKNKAEGEAFLAQNAKKEGVKTLEGGVQYEVMVEGKGPKPKQDTMVKINYHGMFPDGKVFDSTVEARPGKTPGPVELNSGIFVKGFQTALHAMPAGSKWKIVIPGDQAYGMQGRAPVIGPNQTIVFELELLEVSVPADGTDG